MITCFYIKSVAQSACHWPVCEERKEKDSEEKMAMKVFALGKEGKERMARKGREAQRGKDSEERTARKEGKDSEERTARKGWRVKEGKDSEERKERIARKGQQEKDGEERKDFLIRS